MATDTPQTLVKKLAQILATVDKIEKKGYNDHFNYKFVREADLVEAVRSKLAAQNIMITSSVDKTEVVDMTKVTKQGEVVQNRVGLLYVTYTFRDGESGETIQVQGIGEIEQDGGKGIYKAITGAMKYMLMKNFLIDTGDDPEMEKKPKGEAKQQSAAPSAPRNNGVYNAAWDKGYPATLSQKNSISARLQELTPDQKESIRKIVEANGIPQEVGQLTKLQASFIIDKIVLLKNAANASGASNAKPGGTPSQTPPPAPQRPAPAPTLADVIQNMRNLPTLAELEKYRQSLDGYGNTLSNRDRAQLTLAYEETKEALSPAAQ